MGQRVPGSQATRESIFERQRKKAKQQESSAQQQAQEAIARRFAAQGLTASGAQQKLEGQARQQGQRALADRFEDIDTREQAENLRLQEIQEGRQFASSEREAQQQFAAAQAQKQRDLAREQFGKQFGLAEQQFTESQKQFGQQFGLSKDQFEAQFGKLVEVPVMKTVTKKIFGKTMSRQVPTGETKMVRQGGLSQQQMDLAQQEFEASKSANAINAILSAKNSGLNAPLMAAVFGQLGFPIDNNGFVDIGGTKINLNTQAQATPTYSGDTKGFLEAHGYVTPNEKVGG